MSIKSIHVRKRIVIQPEAYNSHEIEVALTAEIGGLETFEEVKANLVGEVNALLIEEAQSAIDALDDWKRDRWLARLGASTPAMTLVIEEDADSQPVSQRLVISVDDDDESDPDWRNADDYADDGDELEPTSELDDSHGEPDYDNSF